MLLVLKINEFANLFEKFDKLFPIDEFICKT